jgi:hypothetical protein
MKASRGMGDLNPSKMPTGKKIIRKDNPNDVEVYKKGGNVNLPGLYANINAKKKRIAKGANEKMRKPGSKGAPIKQDFIDSLKTVKK